MIENQTGNVDLFSFIFTTNMNTFVEGQKSTKHAERLLLSCDVFYQPNAYL